MKLYSTDINKIIPLIASGAVKGLLFHGPNQGFIKSALDYIIKNFNYFCNNYSLKDLSFNKLSLITGNTNFFGQKELILISNLNNKNIAKEITDFLANYNSDNLICFTADDSLNKSNSLRKIFEAGKNLASIACYYDNEQTIAKMIIQQCNKLGKNIDEEALFYLKSHLCGDHQIIKSELNKIFYYTHDKSIITKQDVILCLSSDLNAGGDEMCIYLAQKNYDKFQQEVLKLKLQGINEVLMIRALIRFFLNIYIINLRIEDGWSGATAINSISPAIFYQHIPALKQIINMYSTSYALQILEKLQSMETIYKTNPGSFDLLSVILSKNFHYDTNHANWG